MAFTATPKSLISREWHAIMQATF